ncbi:MAG: hypothetical protein AAGI30_03775 [Planctomycetota bacterium]
MGCIGGSCGPQPRTGKAFDPHAEGPSEADLARFGSDEFDPRELDDDEGEVRPAGHKRVTVAVLGGAGALLAVLSLSGVL